MIVVDTSVLIKFVIPEPRSDVAARLRNERLIAPDIWIAEAGNALWRKALAGEFSERQATDFMSLLLSGEIGIVSGQQEIAAALQIALALAHPIYDCLFLATAIREGTYVVTDDARFAKAVRRHGRWSSHLRLLAEM